MHYVHTDHLGSLNVITNQNGAIEQELGYDAWGNRRNPDTWVNITGTPAGLLTRRGFTGHEHMDEFGIINMNGRLYDPVLGRFLSPDPIVANAANTQDYNRYSYCVNNPLMFTDPSGYRLIDRMTRDGGSCGAGGVGSWGRSAFDWYDALWQARKDGYTGGSMNFIDAYWEQTSDPNYDGTINFHYWQFSTQLVGKNNGRKLGEVKIVNTKVTMEVKWTVKTNDWFNGKYNSEDSPSSNKVLISPVKNSKSNSEFGVYRKIKGLPPGSHPGTDYPVPQGTEIMATANGKVIRANYSSTYGNVIVINHGESVDGSGNVYTVYAHGSKFLVKQNQSVEAGDIIMLSGATPGPPWCQGAHLHYEVVKTKSTYPNNFYNNLSIRYSPGSLQLFLNN